MFGVSKGILLVKTFAPTKPLFCSDEFCGYHKTYKDEANLANLVFEILPDLKAVVSVFSECYFFSTLLHVM